MRIVAERVLCEHAAATLRERTYLDRSGKPRSWSYVERSGKRRAVVVVARTRESGSLLLLRQFRVPFGREVVELPAGLVDGGEEPARAAARELREETGYSGQVVHVGPEVASSAGITTETFRVVDMLVAEEPSSAPTPEASESMELLKVHPGRIPGLLEELVQSGELLDCKSYLVLKCLAQAT